MPFILNWRDARRPNKKQYHRLLRELRRVSSSGGPVLNRQHKNPPARFRNCEHADPGSKFIGVSRNGKKWQALLLVNDRKKYLGTLNDELETALLHDRGAILYHGLKKVSV